MLMQIDGTFLFVVISFLIFLFIIKAILFQPITKVLDERKKFFEKNAKTEADSKEKSKALLEEKENLLSQTRSEASNLLKKASQEAKEEGEILLKETRKERINKIEENQNALNQEKETAKQEAKTEISNIVKSIVSKILDEEVEVNLDDEKINKYLNI